MGWRKKVHKAKKRHRPSLSDWECDRLFEKFPDFVQALPDHSALVFPSRPVPAQQQESSGVKAVHHYKSSLPVHLDAKNLSKDEFQRCYESKCIPCVIDNLPSGFDDCEFVGKWSAVDKWTLDRFDESDIRARMFKCGEDDDGRKIKIKLKHFLRYLHNNKDDSPLYVFDSSFEDDKQAKNLLSDYRVPSYFRDDLFRLVSESRRPPYRWILIGPERSGSTLHQDPLATNAWNTLLSGKKRWVLFPPHVPKSIAKGRGLIGKDEDDEASHYFMNILPRIKRKADAMKDCEEYRDFACYEFTQHAGETVFVPHDWWHAVVNLTDTVGVTQNYGSPRNFEAVWRKTRSSRKRMAWKLLCQLDHHYPELADQARAMNDRDRFRMKYEEQERRRKQQRVV